MHIALCRIPNDSFVVLARRLVRFDIDTKRAVEFELQSAQSLAYRPEQIIAC